MSTGTYEVGYGGVSVYGGGPATTHLAPGAAVQMGGGIEWDDQSTPEAGRCHHKKDDGDFCMRWPKAGDLYCPLHKTDDLANEA